MTLDCVAADACENSQFVAYNTTVMDFECNGVGACEDSTIFAFGESSFSISCSGIFACDNTVCFCDDVATCEKSGSLQCDSTYGTV